MLNSISLDNKTTLWYELCILIKPQTYIIILEQLSTTWIIDIMTRLYHVSRGGRGSLHFKLILVISIKTPPFPVIVINTISSLVLFNTPYEAYFITPHAGLFSTFNGFSYSSLWIINLLIIMIKCPSLYICIPVIYILHVLLITYLHISISLYFHLPDIS